MDQAKAENTGELLARIEAESLACADLRDMRLEDADLRGADLSHARMELADLVGADLSSAVLAGAYLQGAHLNNANLQNAGPIAMTVVCTIILSILLHGITANPWARAYGARVRKADR